MGDMNAGIILSGTQPNILGAMMQGNQAAAQTNGIRQQNALADLYKSQGAGIAQGDPNALNALAGIDPFAAQQAAGTAQDQQFSMERMRMLRAEAKEKAAAKVASMDAAEAAAEAAKIEKAVAAGMAAKSPAEWDAMVTQFGAPDLVGQFENKTAIAFSYMGVADALKEAKGPGAPTPQTTVAKLTADFNAGLIDQATYEAALSKATAQSGTSLTVDPRTGAVTFVQGAGAGQAGGVKPSSPEAMIASIDGILNDPALDKSTGVLSFTQSIPGTDQKRFGARASQLEGQAFLQAFESLKGGGQITEIEGQKATQAIGRLDTSQKPEDYRQALTELRDILSAATARPVGWAEQQNASPAAAPKITSEAEYNALPPGTVFVAPDGTQRRKP